MTPNSRLAHPLCYCDSLPGSQCDFCSGIRVGTIDDYRDMLDAYKRRCAELQNEIQALHSEVGRLVRIGQ